jgi:hypothetical protein
MVHCGVAYTYMIQKTTFITFDFRTDSLRCLMYSRATIEVSPPVHLDSHYILVVAPCIARMLYVVNYALVFCKFVRSAKIGHVKIRHVSPRLYFVFKLL